MLKKKNKTPYEKNKTPYEINKNYTGEQRNKICDNKFYYVKDGKCDYKPCEYISIYSCDNPILKNRCNVILDSNNNPTCKLAESKYSDIEIFISNLFFISCYILLIYFFNRRYNKRIKNLLNNVK